MYDIYGKAGLKAGLDVGTKLKSVDELKAQWEKFRAQQVSDHDTMACLVWKFLIIGAQ